MEGGGLCWDVAAGEQGMLHSVVRVSRHGVNLGPFEWGQHDLKLLLQSSRDTNPRLVFSDYMKTCY